MTPHHTREDEPSAVTGTACSITFLHGVGLDPTLVADVVDELGAREPGLVMHVPRRRGYRGDTPAATFDDLVDDVATIVAATGPTLLVGVSGGATLAVAAAVRRVPGLAAVVAHEPLVGPLAPDLHTAVCASASSLTVDAGEDAAAGAAAFLARLIGHDVWVALPHGAHAFTAEHAVVVHAEVPLFVGFAPTPEELSAVRLPVVVSTGVLSPSARHAAAAVLGAAGASVRVVDGAGHLAIWQRPDRFADIVHEAWLGCAGSDHHTEDAA